MKRAVWGANEAGRSGRFRGSGDICVKNIVTEEARGLRMGVCGGPGILARLCPAEIVDMSGF